jgi:site-specific recombinase XerD
MGQLQERMESDLKLAGYAAQTRKIYLLYARQFAKHFMRSPEEMGEPEIRQFLTYLVEERRISFSTYRQVRAALRLLYLQTIGRPVAVEWIPTRRRDKRLPVVLSGTEVEALLLAIHNLKYRTLITALYAGGLRISEGCRLRPDDIDAKRMVIRVEAGKGRVDRYTLLSTRLLDELRDYWRRYRLQGMWMFPGHTQAGHVSPQSVRWAFQRALVAAGIRKEVTPHVLRHSFATHMLETGVDVTVVQTVLGHASLRATTAYTHISVEHLSRTRSPLDLFGSPAARVLG